MKMIKFILLAVALASVHVLLAQAPPQGINYQAVAVDHNGKEIVGVDHQGQVIPNRQIGIRFSILDNQSTVLYQEEHQTNTDRFGMFALTIGMGKHSGGELESFSEIDWGLGSHFLKVEIDSRGGRNYRSMGTQQFMSVPYALHAKTSDSPGLPGPKGEDGIGIDEIIQNPNGSLTFNYSDGSSFTTASLTGPAGADGQDGNDGQDGASAYQVWLDLGNTGTETDFINSLTGPQGAAGQDGNDGQDGASAYQVWLSLGNTGTETDFINSLTGPQGAAGQDGNDGQDGASAYQVWLSLGNTGTETDFINSLTGPQGAAGQDGNDGQDGASAYQVWLGLGNTGTETDFINSLTGPDGAPGAAGTPGTAGADGADGKTVLSGTVAPTTQGTDGDFYINTATNEIYGPKTAGAWGAATSLVGPAGADGAAGTPGAAGSDGADGKTVLSGTVAPTTQGTDGDFYINTATNEIYGPKTAGDWGAATSLVGSAGATGTPGAAGADGILPDGAASGNTPYWNGTEWVVNNSNIHNNGASVGIGTDTPDGSAKLEIASTSQGLLMPRMTESQRDLITDPVEGLIIYQTDETPGFYYYDGTDWQTLKGNGNTSGGSNSKTLIYTTRGF
jgi:hypothetical protein